MHEHETVQISLTSISEWKRRRPDKPPDPSACVRGCSRVGMHCHCPALSCSGSVIRQNASARSHCKVYRRGQFRKCPCRESRWRRRQWSLGQSGDAPERPDRHRAGERPGSGRNACAVGYDLWIGFLYGSRFGRESLANAVIAGKPGTVYNLEFYSADTHGKTDQIRGVAKDSAGNLYKVVFRANHAN